MANGRLSVVEVRESSTLTLSCRVVAIRPRDSDKARPRHRGAARLQLELSVFTSPSLSAQNNPMKHLFPKQTLLAFTLPWRLKNTYSAYNAFHLATSRSLGTATMADEPITVENYESLLPPFDPNGSGLFGLVDMGR